MELNEKVYSEAISYVEALIKSKGAHADARDIVHDAILIADELTLESIKKALKEVLKTTAIVGGNIVTSTDVAQISKKYGVDTLVCKTCKEELPEGAFSTIVDRQRGIIRKASSCKSCASERAAIHNKKNKLYHYWYMGQLLKKKRIMKTTLKRNYKKCKKTSHICTNCGKLPINHFYVRLYKHEGRKYYISRYCRTCYNKQRKIPKSENYTLSDERRQYKNDHQGAQRKYLAESYIKFALKLKGYSEEQITPKLIKQQRESMLEFRRKKTVPYNERPFYIRALLVTRCGIPRELVTPEMIQDKILSLRQKRLKREQKKQLKNTGMDKKKPTKPKTTSPRKVKEDEEIDNSKTPLYAEPLMDNHSEDLFEGTDDSFLSGHEGFEDES